MVKRLVHVIVKMLKYFRAKIVYAVLYMRLTLNSRKTDLHLLIISRDGNLTQLVSIDGQNLDYCFYMFRNEQNCRELRLREMSHACPLRSRASLNTRHHFP